MTPTCNRGKRSSLTTQTSINTSADRTPEPSRLLFPQRRQADKLAGTLGTHDLSPSVFGNAHCIFHQLDIVPGAATVAQKRAVLETHADIPPQFDDAVQCGRASLMVSDAEPDGSLRQQIHEQLQRAMRIRDADGTSNTNSNT